jgi:Transposase, Mutator family
MAKDHRSLGEEVAQRILLDDPSFLKGIVERVLQELLEAENERARRRVPGFIESYRRRIRTTNTLARFNQNIERRTRMGRILPNRESCLRLVTALAVEVSRSG